jgi:hypothetical protein
VDDELFVVVLPLSNFARRSGKDAGVCPGQRRKHRLRLGLIWAKNTARDEVALAVAAIWTTVTTGRLWLPLLLIGGDPIVAIMHPKKQNFECTFFLLFCWDIKALVEYPIGVARAGQSSIAVCPGFGRSQFIPERIT